MKELNLGGQSLVSGRGSLEHLRTLTARRAFIVTGGSSMIKNGVIAKIESILQANGCATMLHSGVPANPDTDAVFAGVAKMRPFAPDLVIAVGGGSALDAAKVMTLFSEYPDLDFAAALAGALPARRQAVRLVAIPSTSGTGSEVTKVAVVTFHDQNLKIGLRTPAFIPDIAILDADLTLTMPPNVVAETGMDALTHAIEAYVSRFHTPISDMYCLESIRLIGRSLRVACHPATTAEASAAIAVARRDMALAATLAGVALSQAGLGMVHGFAHPVGATTGLAHGLANAILLPFVMEALIPDAGERLSDIGAALVSTALTGAGRPDPAASVRAIAHLGRDIGIPPNLDAAGVPTAAFEVILADALSYRRRKASPRAFTDGELRALLTKMYRGHAMRGD